MERSRGRVHCCRGMKRGSRRSAGPFRTRSWCPAYGRVDRPAGQWRPDGRCGSGHRARFFGWGWNGRRMGGRNFSSGGRFLLLVSLRRRGGMFRLYGGRLVSLGVVRLVLALALGAGLKIGYIESVQPAQPDGDVFVDRTGMRFLLGDAQLGQTVENFVSLHFQLPRQLIDSNLLHRENYRTLPPRRCFHP